MDEVSCFVAGCERPARPRGCWCRSHYARWKKTGEVPTGPIEMSLRRAPCGTPRGEGTCAVEGCERPTQECGYCHTHYERVRLTGDPGTAEIRTPGQAERRFRERLHELGATLLESEYLGSTVPHAVRCSNGHLCRPRPNSITCSRNQGVCRPCGYAQDEHRRAKTRECQGRFHERLAELGATLLDKEWRGVSHGYLVRCRCGYESTTWPTRINAGGSFCIVCAGVDSEAAHRRFIERVTELGGKVLEQEWLGSGRKHRVICVNGHECTPTPDSIRSGQGICRPCAFATLSVFYVVVNESQRRVKFGVTSSEKRRLAKHRRAGYGTLVRLLKGLDNAVPLERNVKTTLRDAGMKPVRGHEYFDISALPLVLDLVDNYPVDVASVSA